MLKFHNAQHPAALSYAAASTGPERVDATLIWKLQRKNRQLESENRLLWGLLLTVIVCFSLSAWAPVIFGRGGG